MADELKWRKLKVGTDGCHKWVSGNNWVTTWDDEPGVCHIGIDGEHSVVNVPPSVAKEVIETTLLFGGSKNG